jgi:hypothetical protein
LPADFQQNLSVLGINMQRRKPEKSLQHIVLLQEGPPQRSRPNFRDFDLRFG